MGGRELSSIRQISNFTQAIRYRMKAKLKVPRRLSNKKDPAAAIEFKKN
jgi:hypothetical protein